MELGKGIVKLGMEIEVADWKEGESYQTTVAELLAADYMWDDGNQWREYHTYHCNCEHGGCRQVRSGNPIYPKPVVSATYDASLPETGAEFITSTIILTDDGLMALKPVWDIVASRAVWNNELRSRQGGRSSPSIHIHVSATSPTYDRNEVGMLRDKSDDFMHMMSLFAPELLAVASSAGVKRGLTFRQPLRYMTDTAHHGFIQMRKAIPGQMVYIEWRMFEAVYGDWEYVEACSFLAAAMTRGLLSDEIFTRLMSSGYSSPYDMKLAETATVMDDTEAILSLVSPERLNILRDVCVTELNDDTYGLTLLDNLFAKTERSLA
jgi:hypothetical protein